MMLDDLLEQLEMIRHLSGNVPVSISIGDFDPEKPDGGRKKITSIEEYHKERVVLRGF